MIDNYNPLFSAKDNFEMMQGTAEFYRKVADNMRTQAKALRALLESLNIPKEEIDRVQYAHITHITGPMPTSDPISSSSCPDITKYY